MCLWRAGRAVSVTTITWKCIDLHQIRSVGAGSDHLHCSWLTVMCPWKGGLRQGDFFVSTYYSQRAVFASLWALFSFILASSSGYWTRSRCFVELPHPRSLLPSAKTFSVLTAIFPGGPGLASTRLSPFWIMLELRVEVVVTTGTMCTASAKSPPTKQHPVFYWMQVHYPTLHRPNALPVTQPKMSEYWISLSVLTAIFQVNLG